MHTVHIKFATEADRTRGFYELAKRTGISSLRGKIYQISRDALQFLDDNGIAYRRATDEEIKQAHDQIRDPSAVVP